jgi:membrane protease YdiL (CAAX protease family)
MLSEKPWRLDWVMAVFLGLFASIALGMLLIQLTGLARGVSPSGVPPFAVFVVGITSFHGAAAVLIFVLLRLQGISAIRSFGFNTPGLKRALLLALGALVVVLPVALGLNWVYATVMEWFQVKPVAQQAVQMLQEQRATLGLGPIIFFGAATILVVPAVEEMLFRGMLYPVIKQEGFPRLAWWGSSLFFAATHMNAMTFIPLTGLALVLVWLYEQTDNLLAPIVTHSLFNAFNFCWLIIGIGP